MSRVLVFSPTPTDRSKSIADKLQVLTLIHPETARNIERHIELTMLNPAAALAVARYINYLLDNTPAA